jgi:hypothetical protein
MNKLTIGLIVSLLINWLISPIILHAELIEPTRTLEAAADNPGVLNVYSEPRGLELRLDGKAIGKTPLVSYELSPGTHVLRVEGSEANFSIDSNQTISLSWFKGTFIQIPEKPKAAAELSTQIKKKEAKPREAESAGGKEGAPSDPFYWPLNPRGPIQ